MSLRSTSSHIEEISRLEAQFKQIQENYLKLHEQLAKRTQCKNRKLPSDSFQMMPPGVSDRVDSSPSSTTGTDDLRKQAATETTDSGVADFMSKQMEVLLAEKARLSEENARLARENSALHDIISITISFEEHDLEEENGCEATIDLPPVYS